MRLLLVEDDLSIGQSLLRALSDAGYGVEWVRDGATGRASIDAFEYTAVLLDLGLPGMSGLDVLRSVRASHKEVPILILTARDDVDTRVQGLDLGADDYLAKPFQVRELLARVRAVMRRKAGYAASRLGDETLCLDLDKRTLSCHGVELALTSREFALMLAFLERPGTILSREQLEEKLYGWGREIESNAIDVLIYSVRKKFGQSVIRNVRGIGWTVILDQDNTN
ncbi:response regulator transcription factor [Burkholderia latens]|uniref:response regulator transcription factor n=1 Tax=Burkholderia latens TaxID=488446 RepID=UPI00158B2BE5|nr:response regulator transcription factor [Burkholderia latens]